MTALSTSEPTAANRARASLIAGMRELLDFLDAHPEIPVTSSQNYNVYVKADALKAIARIGGWQKIYESNSFFTLRRTFGEQQLDIFTDRDAVCRKVVTGTRVVPAQPAIDERIENVEEWVCDDVSLLRAEGEPA